MQKEHAQLMRGVQVCGAISGLRYVRWNLIAAKIESRLLVFFLHGDLTYQIIQSVVKRFFYTRA
ncbi:hypothetical protein [Candidatus Protochlamydia amoebophila]|uniref:Uncharacterized protein n=1 Tax=Candidatus Protochlamydia amoebophila TaxID=362787 RepID=A0A0C1JIR5_9BACT|nr:hypothetical protein [Candidatus Protochlamydia amoebophila]KIC71280.1 hypothetical protein DB44_EB00050 [Candidatus Protochlamydia amoebophila]